jgi:hypothetical protein
MRARDARSRTRGRHLATAASTLFTGALLALPAAAAATPAPGIPDPVAPGVPGHGRAWELVTPPNVTPERIYGGIGRSPFVAVSTSGDRVAYETVNASPQASFGGVFEAALAERGPDGWVDKPLDLPYPELTSLERLYRLEEGLRAFDPELKTSIWSNSLPAPQSGLSLFTRTDDGTYTPLVRIGQGAKGGEVEFVAASRDLRHVFFVSSSHLLAADATRTEGSSLYEFSNSELHLVEVDDGGALLSTCGGGRLYNSTAYSTDGQRVFFRTKPGCGEHERIFLRAGGHTTEISASRCTLSAMECGPEEDVEFLGATPDGSVAYISTAQRLTDDDTNATEDLYRYDVSDGELALLTPGSAVSQYFLGTFTVRPSDDGSRAYFAAAGQVIPGEGAGVEPNLFLADSQGLHLVGPLSEVRFQPSPDGRYVFFTTSAQLTPGDSDESPDIYRYDATTDHYLLVSAGEDGSGNGIFSARLVGKGAISQQVFFTTEEPLLPQDHNEQSDVYEWTEAGGLGLVSAGTPDFKAEYLGGTADARTILIRTGATLLPRDRDGGELDIYAARVGGGFAEPAAPAACGSGACEAPSAAGPHRTLPAGGPGKPFIGLAPIDAAARRQLVAKGATTLLLEVPAAGRLTAQGRARIGSHEATVASGGAVAKAAGPVRMRLRLAKIARRSLAQGHDLRVRLLLRFPGKGLKTKDSFTLRGAR